MEALVPNLWELAAACLGLHELASRVKHALEKRADHGRLAEDDEFEALLRDERDVLAWCHGLGWLFAESDEANRR